MLSRASRFLDLGCGPGGALTLIVGQVGCYGSGLDVSSKALCAGRARVASLGLDGLVTLREADLNQPIPFASGSFEAADLIGRYSSSSRPLGGVPGSGTSPDSGGKAPIHRGRSHYGCDFR
jgi:SAM-dependent methyltransferase